MFWVILAWMILIISDRYFFHVEILFTPSCFYILVWICGEMFKIFQFWRKSNVEIMDVSKRRVSEGNFEDIYSILVICICICGKKVYYDIFMGKRRLSENIRNPSKHLQKTKPCYNVDSAVLRNSLRIQEETVRQ